MFPSASKASSDANHDLRVKPKTVTAETAAKLRQAISSGRFKPGERLVESSLCQLMGVSRTSIREALRRLEAEHLVANSPNVGPSVALIDWQSAQQIYEVRALLEGEAAALCAERGSPDSLARMAEALKGFELAVKQDDPEGRINTTAAFYEAILDGAANEVLRDAVLGLNARVSLLRATSMSRKGRAIESAAELRRIYTEIKGGDAAKARAAAQDHIRSAAAAALSVFSNTAESSPAA